MSIAFLHKIQEGHPPPPCSIPLRIPSSHPSADISQFSNPRICLALSVLLFLNPFERGTGKERSRGPSGGGGGSSSSLSLSLSLCVQANTLAIFGDLPLDF